MQLAPISVSEGDNYCCTVGYFNFFSQCAYIGWVILTDAREVCTIWKVTCCEMLTHTHSMRGPSHPGITFHAKSITSQNHIPCEVHHILESHSMQGPSHPGITFHARSITSRNHIPCEVHHIPESESCQYITHPVILIKLRVILEAAQE